jgi:hypothetical protein
MSNKSLELQIFDSESWDVIDTMCFHFYNCTLKVQVGEYPPSTKIEGITMDYQNSLMLFLWHSEPYEDGHCDNIEGRSLSVKTSV